MLTEPRVVNPQLIYDFDPGTTTFHCIPQWKSHAGIDYKLDKLKLPAAEERKDLGQLIYTEIIIEDLPETP